MRSRYPQILLGRLRPLNVRIPDLDETVTMTIADGSLTRADKNAQADVEIYSQPLHYCLAQPWGMGTLTISGRFNLLRNERNWKGFKALFALNNAEVYLRPHYLFRRQNWGYPAVQIQDSIARTRISCAEPAATTLKYNTRGPIFREQGLLGHHPGARRGAPAARPDRLNGGTDRHAPMDPD